MMALAAVGAPSRSEFISDVCICIGSGFVQLSDAVLPHVEDYLVVLVKKLLPSLVGNLSSATDRAMKLRIYEEHVEVLHACYKEMCEGLQEM